MSDTATQGSRPLASILSGLADGSVTVEEAEADFGTRTWPRRPAAPKVGGVIDDTSDPEPEPEGSWAEVEAEYIAGRMDADTYARLAAAASGKTTKDTPASEG